MFFKFPASIALVSVLSLITVNSAPVERAVTQQFCTGVNGTGTCTPLNGADCTNTPGVASLILNRDADCDAFPQADCKFGFEEGDAPVQELFSDDSQDIRNLGILSVSCGNFPGTVNGFTAGSSFDIEQEKTDAAKGVLVPE
ncbi:hypothetical protein DFH08DRAFT_972527 [Mycena albidolilacea]|uniref:Uncharacterized protein n=1 Tax=Mycena albidolilacea TaxID=1033008 RepID=A0AAD7EDF7_9AGAR|nr:hypothetical protein DFH08DRAFT_972527 [Mycena albidolilacea]